MEIGKNIFFEYFILYLLHLRQGQPNLYRLDLQSHERGLIGFLIRYFELKPDLKNVLNLLKHLNCSCLTIDYFLIRKLFSIDRTLPSIYRGPFLSWFELYKKLLIYLFIAHSVKILNIKIYHLWQEQ